MGRSGIPGGFPQVYLHYVRSISHGALAFKPVAEHLPHSPRDAL